MVVFVLFSVQCWPAISPLLPSGATRVRRVGITFLILGGWNYNETGHPNSRSTENAKSVGGSDQKKYPMITSRI